ncbi:MAG: hypothetical protein HYX65_06385 [Gemmatimonadetes bacterium]|nr:hypothetical protein [Gemmatimonadota bacterium]
MQHGFLSDRSTWNSVKWALAKEFDAEFYNFTTGAGKSFPAQADSLRAQWTGFPSNTVYIGHSNGGLVGRELLRSGSAWKGIITVGTLHTGAPLAASAQNGTLAVAGTVVIQSVLAPIVLYSSYLEQSVHWFAISEYAFAIADVVGQFGFIYALVHVNNSDVLSQMHPASGYLADLNSGANLAHESAMTSHRIEVSSTLNSSNGIRMRAFGVPASSI